MTRTSGSVPDGRTRTRPLAAEALVSRVDRRPHGGGALERLACRARAR